MSGKVISQEKHKSMGMSKKEGRGERTYIAGGGGIFHEVKKERNTLVDGLFQKGRGKLKDN